MRSNALPAALCGLLAVLWTTWGAPAMAGTLQVNPVLVAIDSDHRTASITIRNEDPVPVTIRSYALIWRQADGNDVYEETGEVIVSPPVFTIAPGATQVVRVGLRNPAAAGKAYRLIVEEVPEASPGGGIRVALRLNLPFFAHVGPGDAAQLRWSASRDADGIWFVEAANQSAKYVRIDGAAASAATGLRFDDDMHFGTVLPGGMRRWPLGREIGIVDQRILQQIARSGDRDAIRTAQSRN